MKSKSQKLALALLLSNIFITFVGISLVIPVLPSLMNELSISGTVVGNMVAAFALAQLIASPFTGKWTDKYGRKIMIIVGLSLWVIYGIVKWDIVIAVANAIGVTLNSILLFLKLKYSSKLIRF